MNNPKKIIASILHRAKKIYFFVTKIDVFVVFKIAAQTLVLLLVGLILLQISPFGISERADKYSQDLFNHYMGDWLYPDTHQHDSVVLLLTDEVIETELQGRWPAPYDFHGKVLNTLLLHDPDSIFIDLLWMDRDKPGLGYLLKVLEKYKQKSIPVYMAVKSRDSFLGIWPELKDLVIPVSAQIGFDPSDFVARQYLFSSGELETAAFSMAKALKPELGSIDPDGRMDIFWGTRENSFNISWMDIEHQENASFMNEVAEGFTDFKRRPPYNTTFFVRDLLNPIADTEAKAMQELHVTLQGKHIFYGANLLGVQDIVLSPTREILPGVYYHAMAFDNLLTWGTAYKSEVSQSLPMWQLDLAVLLPVALIGIIAHHNTRKNNQLDNARQLSRRRHPWSVIIKNLSANSFSHVSKWLFSLLALLFWIGLCSWIEFRFFNVSAASWLGYLGVITLGFATEKLDLVERGSQWLSKNIYQEKQHD
ncbi:CHASE2 domain-containing protein [Vreelandella rituensis]|uniref:CHASE2 domain-containing protein n=1 Tax=Vreelandella rituensis TaxID=2282306 RepID=A0A368TZG6_9GAMM|nr:CHASE2 domain-containing protein [Halomonas rituensis]RCV89981.1 CHASE2 domain-containing protein [Halomonas rituensis]